MRPNITHSQPYGRDNRIDRDLTTNYFNREHPTNYNGRTLILDENAKFQPNRPTVSQNLLYLNYGETITLNDLIRVNTHVDSIPNKASATFGFLLKFDGFGDANRGKIIMHEFPLRSGSGAFWIGNNANVAQFNWQTRDDANKKNIISFKISEFKSNLTNHWSWVICTIETDIVAESCTKKVYQVVDGSIKLFAEHTVSYYSNYGVSTERNPEISHQDSFSASPDGVRVKHYVEHYRALSQDEILEAVSTKDYFHLCWSFEEGSGDALYSTKSEKTGTVDGVVSDARVVDSTVLLTPYSGDILGTKIDGLLFDNGYDEFISTSSSGTLTNISTPIIDFRDTQEWSLMVDVTIHSTSGSGETIFGLYDSNNNNIIAIEQAGSGLWIYVSNTNDPTYRIGTLNNGDFSDNERLCLIVTSDGSNLYVYLDNSVIYSDLSSDFTIDDTAITGSANFGIGTNIGSVVNSTTYSDNLNAGIVHRVAAWTTHLNDSNDRLEIQNNEIKDWSTSVKNDMVEAWDLHAEKVVNGYLGNYPLYNIGENAVQKFTPNNLGLGGKNYWGRNDYPAHPLNNPTITFNGVDDHCTLQSGINMSSGSTYKISALITNYSDTGKATLLGSSNNHRSTLGFSGNTFCFQYGSGSTKTQDTGQDLTALGSFLIDIEIEVPVNKGTYSDSIKYTLRTISGETLNIWETSEISGNISWYELDMIAASLNGLSLENQFTGDITWLKLYKDDILTNYWTYLGFKHDVVYDVIASNNANIQTSDIDSVQGVQDLFSYKLEHGFTRYTKSNGFVDIPHSYVGNRNFFEYFNQSVPVEYSKKREYPVGGLYVDEERFFSEYVSDFRTLYEYDFDDAGVNAGLGYTYVNTLSQDNVRLVDGTWSTISDLGTPTPYELIADYTSDTNITINGSAYSVKINATQTGNTLPDALYLLTYTLLNTWVVAPINWGSFEDKDILKISFDARLIASGTTTNVYHFDSVNGVDTQITTGVTRCERIVNYSGVDPRERSIDRLDENFYMGSGSTTGSTFELIFDNFKLEVGNAAYDVTPNEIQLVGDIPTIPNSERRWGVGKPLNTPRTYARKLDGYSFDNIHFNLFEPSIGNNCLFLDSGDYLTTSSPIEYDSIDMSVYFKASGSTGYFDILDNGGSDTNERVRLRIHEDGSNSGLTVSIASGSGLSTFTTAVNLNNEIQKWSSLRFIYNRNSDVSVYVNNRLVIDESLTDFTTNITSGSTIASNSNTGVLLMKDLNFTNGPRYLMGGRSGTTVYDHSTANHGELFVSDIDGTRTFESEIPDDGQTYGHTDYIVSRDRELVFSDFDINTTGSTDDWSVEIHGMLSPKPEYGYVYHIGGDDSGVSVVNSEIYSRLAPENSGYTVTVSGGRTLITQTGSTDVIQFNIQNWQLDTNNTLTTYPNYVEFAEVGSGVDCGAQVQTNTLNSLDTHLDGEMVQIVADVWVSGHTAVNIKTTGTRAADEYTTIGSGNRRIIKSGVFQWDSGISSIYLRADYGSVGGRKFRIYDAKIIALGTSGATYNLSFGGRDSSVGLNINNLLNRHTRFKWIKTGTTLNHYINDTLISSGSCADNAVVQPVVGYPIDRPLFTNYHRIINLTTSADTTLVESGYLSSDSYTSNGGGTTTQGYRIPSMGTKAMSENYSPSKVNQMTVKNRRLKNLTKK